MAGWRVLTPAQGGKPTLLIKADFKTTEYTVFVTDLIHIWQETLGRKAIVRRSLDDDTSIDASEDFGQLQQLLQKVQGALTGEIGTSQKLSQAEDGNDLLLELQSELPGGLKPLVWKMLLKHQAGDILFQQLLLPAFERSLQAQSQVQDLLKLVEAKDHVIMQLQDKLENTGTELSNVFPGAHARKGSKAVVQESLYRAIPALRPFDETRWRQAANHNHFNSSADLFQGVFADLEDSELAANWRSPDHWWHKLDQKGQDLGIVPSRASNVTPNITQQRSLPEDDINEFQSQDHPKLRTGRHSSPQVQVKDSQPAGGQLADDNMSTTDDGEDRIQGDLDAIGATPLSETLAPSPPRRVPAPSNARKRIGMLGKKEKETAPSASPPPIPEALSASIEPDSLPAAAEPRKKLGRIGGGRQHTAESAMKSLPMRDPHELSKVEQPRTASAAPPIPKPEAASDETEEERAERRRAELKRQLDEKKKAPAKKKRKF